MSLRLVAQKAMRLYAMSNITEYPDARVFEVEGDTGSYTVALFDTGGEAGGSCTCLAVGVCAHIGAALLEAKEAA